MVKTGNHPKKKKKKPGNHPNVHNWGRNKLVYLCSGTLLSRELRNYKNMKNLIMLNKRSETQKAT